MHIPSHNNHQLELYMAQPSTTPKGVIIVLHEIFGLNSHIKKVCDDYANNGYIAIAPDLYSRIQPHLTFPFSQENMAQHTAMNDLYVDDVLHDVQSTIQFSLKFGKIALVGFSYGATLAWLCAGNLHDITVMIGYYGSRIRNHTDLEPKCPVLLHFGEEDNGISLEKINEIQSRYKHVNCQLYPGHHGFACQDRDTYNHDSSILAHQRTLIFLKECIDNDKKITRTSQRKLGFL